MLWMLFLLIFSLGKSRKKIAYSEIFKILGFSYLTFISQRNIAPFAIILLPILSRVFWDMWTETRAFLPARRKKTSPEPQQIPLKITRLINGMLIFIISLTALGNLYLLTRPDMVDKHYPLSALAWIEENQPEGALFNSYNWGGYLIWNLREYPVFIDGRADLYGEEMLNQWKKVISGGAESQKILNQWDVNLILVEADLPMVKELAQEGWELLYKDNMSVVYGR
jgi:hypothetical protein